jgi:hypothetical protein
MRDNCTAFENARNDDEFRRKLSDDGISEQNENSLCYLEGPLVAVNVELALDEELGDLPVETICERKSDVTRISGRRRMGNELLHTVPDYIEPWW